MCAFLPCSLCGEAAPGRDGGREAEAHGGSRYRGEVSYGVGLVNL